MFFSKRDAFSGYWQSNVDQESSQLLAFSTRLGCYRFKRLPYGIRSDSEVFQREITSVISDDLGSDNSQDLQKWNKVEKKKCQIGVKSIVFLEHIISSEDVKVDRAKIETITKMLLPNSVNELQRFLGMITYFGKFIPNLAEVTSPLCTLLEKEVLFKLEKPQLDAIGKLKLFVTTTPCLKILNPNLQTRLKIDASSEELGALLEQSHRTITYPVGYASRSLRDYEKRYAQIEKETLSIVFGVERFHEYLYGRKFTVINNHQPLKPIFSKINR